LEKADLEEAVARFAVSEDDGIQKVWPLGELVGMPEVGRVKLTREYTSMPYILAFKRKRKLTSRYPEPPEEVESRPK
jgi:hypothetical protein